MKRFIVFLLSVTLFLCLASCSVNEEFNTDDNIIPDATREQITFTDFLGRAVKVDKSPERVACLLGSFAEIWMLAGGDVVAAADDAWQDFTLGLSENTVNIGGAHSPSLELILSSCPDFVIASASTASNVELMEALEKSGTPVAYFDIDCFENYLLMLDICTDITGRKELYKQNGIDIKEQIDDIKSEFSSLMLDENQRKILILRASSSSVKAKGSEGTVLGEMLCDLGCVNIADSEKSLLENLSVEKVISEDPYRIFVVTMGNNENAAKENISKLIYENPAWSGLDAVKNGRLHFMEKRLFNIKPNVRWAEAYEKLTAIFKNG